MEKKLVEGTLPNGQISENRRTLANEENDTVVSSDYFSAQSVMILLCLAVSLLILPLILPPLPPPPLMLLALPLGILLVLLILACMPSDVRNMASSYL